MKRDYFQGVEPCKKCGSYTMYKAQVGPHIGIYCANCYKWQHWLKHKLAEHIIPVDNTSVPQFVVVNEYDAMLQQTNSEFGGELNEKDSVC